MAIKCRPGLAVQPDAGKVGAVLPVLGVYLGKAKVDVVYLSDHTFDMKVKVLDQKHDVIEFRIPSFAKPGRLQTVVKTTGKQPLIVEQPVYINVEEATDQRSLFASSSQSRFPLLMEFCAALRLCSTNPSDIEERLSLTALLGEHDNRWLPSELLKSDVQ